MKSRWIGLLVVFIFSTLIAWRQFNPGKWLIGWDSLHPEFNYNEAFERMWSGGWRENQGLGAIAIHSHMSDFVRVGEIWLIDQILPMSAVRMSWTLLMFVVGPLGMYVLLFHILARIRKNLSINWISTISIAGSLLYIFNLSTLHHFLVPFEMFVVLYAYLPWSLWSVSRYFESPSRGRLAFSLILQILIAPSAFAATLWIIYFGFLMVTSFFLAKGKKKLWLKFVIMTLGVNLYWIFPTIYGLLNSGEVVEQAKINLLFSPEAWLNNVAYGTFPKVLSLESFILEWVNFNRKSSSFGLISDWMTSGGGEIKSLYPVGFIVILGFLLTLFSLAKKTNVNLKRWSGFVISTVVLFTLLLSNAPFIGSILEKVRDGVPLLGEILRTPFTKVSIELQLSFAVFLAIMLLRLFEKIRIGLIRVILVLGTMIMVVYPFRSWIVSGNIFANSLTTTLPQEYLELFAQTKKMDLRRMVQLPVDTMWGWEYRDWKNENGYEGANFTQFGIMQPLLTRDFDRWNPYNETFYQQFSTALYNCPDYSVSICGTEILNLMNRYDVRYALLDESIIAPGQDEKVLRFETIKKLAQELGWKEVFKENFLTVWDTGVDGGEQFVSSPKSFTLAEGPTEYTRKNVVSDTVGSYVNLEKNDGVYLDKLTNFPLADLLREETKGVSYSDSEITIKRQLSNWEDRELVMPRLTMGKSIAMSYEVGLRDGELEVKWKPLYKVNDESGPTIPSSAWKVGDRRNVWVKVGEGNESALFIEEGQTKSGTANLVVDFPVTVKIYEGTTSRIDKVADKFAPGKVQKCWESEEGKGTAIGRLFDGYLQLTTKGASACVSVPLVAANSDELLQVALEYRSTDDVRPELCLDKAGDPYRCENLPVWSETSAVSEWDYVMRTLALKKGEQYYLDVSSKSVSPYDKERVIEYKVPLVVRYQLVSSEVIVEAWKDLIEEHKFPLDDQELRISSPSKVRSYDFTSLGVEELKNCDVLSRGSISKVGREYSASERGAACDYVEMTSVVANKSYLMRLRGENIEGRSVKFFLHNTESNRNDIEYLLGSGEFDQSFALVQWNLEGNYVLNIETRSFGQPTRNRMKEVEIRDIPLTEIAEAKVVKKGENVSNYENRLSIEKVKKIGTWLYIIESKGDGLLRLSQGFDKGWIGVGVGEDGGYDLAHGKVDGWANGWMVPAGVDKIVILFWPQILEYVGFVILAVTLLLVLRVKKSSLVS